MAAGAWPTTWPSPTDVLPVRDENAREDNVWWQARERTVLKRINALLSDIQRNGNDGTGKPAASTTISPGPSIDDTLGPPASVGAPSRSNAAISWCPPIPPTSSGGRRRRDRPCAGGLRPCRVPSASPQELVLRWDVTRRQTARLWRGRSAGRSRTAAEPQLRTRTMQPRPCTRSVVAPGT